MSLISLAISILWIALGVLVLGAIIWVALYAIKLFMPIPDPVEKVVWAAFLILVLIGILTAIVNGGGAPFHWRTAY